MRAGLLRCRIELQSDFGGQDVSGQPVKQFAKYADRWAEILPLNGRERYTADQVQADVTHQITVRDARSLTVKPKDRAVYRGRIFNITEVVRPAERVISLRLMAVEEV